MIVFFYSQNNIETNVYRNRIVGFLVYVHTSFWVCTNKNSSSFTQSIAQFNQASASERQQFIARMANESQSVIIPNSVDSLYRSEADKLGIPEPTYTKYKILLK